MIAVWLFAAAPEDCVFIEVPPDDTHEPLHPAVHVPPHPPNCCGTMQLLTPQPPTEQLPEFVHADWLWHAALGLVQE